MPLDRVFLDIGGPIYLDAPYRLAIRDALRGMGAGFADDGYEAGYERCRAEQRGSFTWRLAPRFPWPDPDVNELVELPASPGGLGS